MLVVLMEPESIYYYKNRGPSGMNSRVRNIFSMLFEPYEVNLIGYMF
jgi:hypothetical protein